MRQLEAAVVREAKRFNVSPAFVIATAVADTLGVKEQIDYTTVADERARPRLVRRKLAKSA